MTVSDLPALAPDDFAVWYEAAWPRLVRAVALFTGDLDAAADLAADACAKALSRWDGPSRPADPTKWATVVAINLAKADWRRSSRQRPERTWDGRKSVDLAARDVDLWAAVAALAPRAREAVALRYGLDLTESAVADAMGITPGAVAATLHDARRALRKRLGDDHRD